MKARRLLAVAGVIVALLAVSSTPVQAEIVAGASTATLTIPSHRYVDAPGSQTPTLEARTYLPDPLPGGPLPGIAFVGGGAGGYYPLPNVAGGTEAMSHLLSTLGSRGYAVIIVAPGDDPGCTAPVGSTTCRVLDHVDAIRSGLDWLDDDAQHPGLVDDGALGAMGYSTGARGVSFAQSVDDRIQAIVALDNLASNMEGDKGSPSGGEPGTLLPEAVALGRVTPRVPAMGQASDGAGYTDPGNKDPEKKKVAYDLWRDAGIEAMELVFEGAGHGNWGNSQDDPVVLAVNAHYVTAWFDRWLKHDPTATDRLLQDPVQGVGRLALLDDTYHSAVALDGIDCPDLRAGCDLAPPPVVPEVPWPAAALVAMGLATAAVVARRRVRA
jgi:hypothetical protein